MARWVDKLRGRGKEFDDLGIDFNDLAAGHIMESRVTTCNQESMADRVAIAITTGHFGSLPVVDEEGRLVGIISEFDLLKALDAGKDLQRVTVKEIMTPEAISVKEGATAKELMKILEENHLIRVPVVDEVGSVVGVVARRDILHGYIQSKIGDLHWWM